MVMKRTMVAANVLRRASDVLRGGQRRLGDMERVCRFLRGRLEFKPRPDDVYVATYPRSGTTWVQFILYLLRSDRKMDFEHISQVSPWFERTLALGTKEAADFDGFASPRCFKTHLTPDWLPKAGRVIYIERNGLDVAVSYYNLYRSHLGYRGSLEAFFERFMTGRLQYRSWFDHTERWRKFAAYHPGRVLMLRYEEMIEQLPDVVGRIARFVGFEPGAHEVSEVVRMAGFDFMRAHQAQFDPLTETLLDQGLIADAFIRRGRPGSGRCEIGSDQRGQFERTMRYRRHPAPREWRLHDFLH